MNQIIQLLEEQPCTNDELPYRISGLMSLKNRTRIRSIRVAWSRSRNGWRGQFYSVYYLVGDEDRAVKKFAEVNADKLQSLNFSHNTTIDSGLPKDIARKLKAVL